MHIFYSELVDASVIPVVFTGISAASISVYGFVQLGCSKPYIKLCYWKSINLINTQSDAN